MWYLLLVCSKTRITCCIKIARDWNKESNDQHGSIADAMLLFLKIFKTKIKEKEKIKKSKYREYRYRIQWMMVWVSELI